MISYLASPMPSNKSYPTDDRYDSQWDRFPLRWLMLFSEGLELALKVKSYTDKNEIIRTLESLRRNRSARKDSDSTPEPAIDQELWKDIAEVGRLRRGLELFLDEPKFKTRPDRMLARDPIEASKAIALIAHRVGILSLVQCAALRNSPISLLSASDGSFSSASAARTS